VDARCDDPHASLAMAGGRSHERRSRRPHPIAAGLLDLCTGPFRFVVEVRAVLRVWRRRFRYRRELARLRSSGPHLIEDIGLLQDEADREAAKPFWRP
jgi:uncharacterized protein YjiS (DUF1127 family)